MKEINQTPYAEVTQDFKDQFEVVKQAQTPRGEQVDYSIVGHSPRVDVFINGFNEGRQAIRNFALDYAEAGGTLLITDQNKDGKQPDELRKNATRKQAENHAAAIKAAGLDTQNALRLVAHSYGALIAQEVVRTAFAEDWACKDDIEVVYVAPAGTVADDSFIKIAGRFAKTLALGSKFDKVYDPDKRMIKAGVKNAIGSPLVSLREARELGARRLSFVGMARLGVEQTVISYADDHTFRYDLIEPSISQAEDLLANHGKTLSWQSMYVPEVAVETKAIEHKHQLLEQAWSQPLSPKDAHQLKQQRKQTQAELRQAKRIFASESAFHNDILMRTKPIAQLVLNTFSD